VQVNAITKSGTNQLSGSFGGYFRDDAFNSADHVLHRVLPFSNQQYSTTVGGPIVADKLHFFGNFEYERAPRSTAWNTRYPEFNIDLSGTNTRKMGGGRVDYQMSPNTRIMGKGHAGRRWDPFTDGNTNHPAGTSTTIEESNEWLGSFTQVLSNRALNEIKGGYAKFLLSNYNLTTWDTNLQAAVTEGLGGPRIRFQGFQVPGNANHPRTRFQEMYNVRDDFTITRGRHDFKVGGEYLFYHELTQNRRNANYIIDAANRPPPANLPAILPDWENADTWKLNELNSLIRRITIGVGDFNVDFNQNRFAAWVQDDWRIRDRLTLNLGLRYDVTSNGFANDAAFPPFVEAGRSDDTNNIQPRFGFAYQINDLTVLRGGSGIYFGDAISPDVNWMYGNTQIATIQIVNDGRADFATNPFNGAPLPTYAQAQQLFCNVRNVPGCLFNSAQELAPPFAHLARSWQSSLGFQRQIRGDLAVEADYVYTDVINEKLVEQNINLTYNAATGVNNPFNARPDLRAFPTWGTVSMSFHQGQSDYHGLQMALTKRFRNRWQGAATYTLAWLKNRSGLPHSGTTQVTFPVAPDLGDEYTYAVTDQRNRMVLNGIWDMGWGFQLSGLYFFGSGERYETNYGGDVRDYGSPDGSARLRPDGTIVPRNDLVGDSVNRTDLRLQKRFTFGRRMSADGIVEVHNLFDQGNYGTYITEESNPAYGQPDVNLNIAYGPRVFTFGFRFMF
jgi:hypothetical protein